VEKKLMRVLTIVGFLAIIAAAAVSVFVAHITPQKFASLPTMLNHVMDSRITRVGITAAWWWFGWHFLFGPTVQLFL